MEKSRKQISQTFSEDCYTAIWNGEKAISPVPPLPVRKQVAVEKNASSQRQDSKSFHGKCFRT